MLGALKAWLEDRAGAGKALRSFMDEAVPKSTGWRNTLGSVAGALILLQLVTGILLMLFGGFVEYRSSIKGQMTLHEGGVTGPVESDEFQSYFEWEITVSEARASGPVTELVIPGERFVSLDPSATATFQSGEMPFDLEVSRISKNSDVVQASGRASDDGPVVDAFCLRRLDQEQKAELDVLGLYATLQVKRSGARARDAAASLRANRSRTDARERVRPFVRRSSIISQKAGSATVNTSSIS